MATDVDVQYFSHLNGLTLGNNWGDLIRLLDTCLVNGLALPSVTSASIDAQGDITLNLYSAHNCLLLQIVELTGFNAVSLGGETRQVNGKYRIKGVPSTNQLILKGVVRTDIDLSTVNLISIGSAKLAPLGYEIIFRDAADVKRVYRAKNPNSRHPFIRVDESISEGTNSYNSNYARYAMVGLMEHMNHIDDYENPEVLQLPFDPVDPAKNWKITGSSDSVKRGWARWYWSRSSEPATYAFSADYSGSSSGARNFSIVGDVNAFYFLTDHIGTRTGKVLNGVGCVQTDQSLFGQNWFLMCTLSTDAANQGSYWGANGFQPLMVDKNISSFLCTPDEPSALNHLTAYPIVYNFQSGYENVFDGSKVPAIEIPFYDSQKRLRGCLPHIYFAGRLINPSYTQPICDENSMYISDIVMTASLIGGLYFYLGELE